MSKLSNLLFVGLTLLICVTKGQRVPSAQTSFGGKTKHSYIIPAPSWVNTPTVSSISKNVLDIFGREIHFSTIYKQLNDFTKRQFPVKQTTDADSPFEVRIRGDCVYLDADVSLQGLKKLTIHARKLVSNGKKLTLKASNVCQGIDWRGKCTYFSKAATSSNGRNGKTGIASPLVEINVHAVDGNVEIISEASNGNRGEDGGNGRTGDRGHKGTSPGCYRKVLSCPDLTGHRGYTGKTGESGRRAGRSGNGGNSRRITLNTESISGLFKVTQRTGKGGPPAIHGSGGRGGPGGEGGCGVDCRVQGWGRSCKPTSECVRSKQGPTGYTGSYGKQGYQIYSTPTQGSYGIVERSVLHKVNSLKQWFVRDVELQELIHRRGELLFQRNRTDEAYEIFSFLQSVTDVKSYIHKEVLSQMTSLKQGFDFYGNSVSFAPNLGWIYLRDRATDLLATGEKYESTYNTVKNKMDNIVLAAKTMRDAVYMDIEKSKKDLGYEKNELKIEIDLYINALRQLEETMREEQKEIENLIPILIKEKKQDEKRRQGKLFLDFFSAMLGFPVAYAAKDPQLAFDSTMQVFEVMASAPGCSTPTFNEVKDTLGLRLNFAIEFDNMEDFDLSKMDVSAVPIIMESDFAKNKEKLVHELDCLLDTEGKSDTVKTFERVLDDFFRDGHLRISLINKIINLQSGMKQVDFSLGMLNEWKKSVDTLVSSSTNSIPMSVKRSFTDLLYSMYEQNEATIIRSLYELAKAYQFTSLWKLDALENYVNSNADRIVTNNLGSLNGMYHLVEIKESLENQRDGFLNLMSASGGARSHTYTVLREFDDVTYPGLFDMLRKNGRFTVHLNLDPNNIITTGCLFCYNARLISIYVELTGLAQPNGVPSRIYVKVSHMGDSYFLLPNANEKDAVIHFQQKPDDLDGGHVIFFNRNKFATSVTDPVLREKFQQSGGNRFCQDYNSAQDFFGGQLCKSPYATYAITIPRSQSLPCNRHVSGTNCRELDFTRFKKVRIFMKARAWSDYVAPRNSRSVRVYRDQSSSLLD